MLAKIQVIDLDAFVLSETEMELEGAPKVGDRLLWGDSRLVVETFEPDEETGNCSLKVMEQSTHDEMLRLWAATEEQNARANAAMKSMGYPFI